MSKLSAFQKDCEQKIRILIKDLKKEGILVRREKLTRGPSFRVKSGRCELTGSKIIFLDRRLPPEQQLQIIESAR